MYFDVVDLVRTLAYQSQQEPLQGNKLGKAPPDNELDEVNSILKELLPTTKQIIKIIEDEFNVTVSEDNTI